MAQTLKEKIGKKELFHETLSDPEGDIELTIEYEFICLASERAQVLLTVSQMEQLMIVGPRVIKRAKEIKASK
jgi:hypothetical protein